MAQVGTRRRWGSEKGAQLIEFALVLPLLLLVVLGIVEFGFIFQRYEALTNSAREGARIAVLPGYCDNATECAANVKTRVRAYLVAGGVPVVTTGTGNPVIVVTDAATATAAGPVNTKRVTVTYTYTFNFLSVIDSWFNTTFSTLPMSAVADMRVELAGT